MTAAADILTPADRLVRALVAAYGLDVVAEAVERVAVERAPKRGRRRATVSRVEAARRAAKAAPVDMLAVQKARAAR